jgi:gamma-glutamyltranspeptidase
VLQVVLGVLDFHATAEEAVANARLHEQGTPDVVLIEEKMPQSTRDALEQMRYKLRVIPQLGAVNAITIAPGNLHGAFDLRKGGGASGY